MNWYYTRENIATKVNNNHIYEVLKHKNILLFHYYLILYFYNTKFK